MMASNRRRSSLAVVIVMCVAAVATACTSEPEPTTAPTPDTSTEAMTVSEAMAACMQDKGWNVVALPDNSWATSGGVPQEQVDQFNDDTAECNETTGALHPPPPMTEEQAAAYLTGLYDVAECVRDRGYEVGEPPSRRAAIEAIMSPPIDLDGWEWPYGRLRLGENISSSAELTALYAACPLPPWP